VIIISVENDLVNSDSRTDSSGYIDPVLYRHTVVWNSWRRFWRGISMDVHEHGFNSIVPDFISVRF